MNLLRKTIGATSALVLAAAMTGCAEGSDGGTGTGKTGFDPSSPINVLTREDGSGTRSAFAELFGLEEKQADGTKVDLITQTAVVTNSTSVMLTTVSDDPAAIGYVSLGSLNDTVKAINIDGQPATAEAIKEGTYKISRPFNLVVKEDISAAAQDFMNFMLSDKGQTVVSENNYIPLEDTTTWTAGDVSGKVTVSGSSSVTPLMEKIKEAYAKEQPDVTVEIQQSDSSSGISDAADGVSDLGMPSRELKDSETEKGVKSVTIALDGIAVIVNKENTAENLTSDQVKSIYSGETTVWNEILD